MVVQNKVQSIFYVCTRLHIQKFPLRTTEIILNTRFLHSQLQPCIQSASVTSCFSIPQTSFDLNHRKVKQNIIVKSNIFTKFNNTSVIKMENVFEKMEQLNKLSNEGKDELQETEMENSLVITSEASNFERAISTARRDSTDSPPSKLLAVSEICLSSSVCTEIQHSDEMKIESDNCDEVNRIVTVNEENRDYEAIEPAQTILSDDLQTNQEKEIKIEISVVSSTCEDKEDSRYCENDLQVQNSNSYPISEDFNWISDMPFISEEIFSASEESESEGVYKLNKLFSGRLFEKDDKRKKHRSESRSSESSDGGKLRPNYFVGVRIADPEIQERVKKVQEFVVEKKSILKNAIIPLETLHVTLSVLCIPDEKELKRVCICLEECQPMLKEIVSSPLHLEFEGLDHFQNQVLFCKPKPNESLERLEKVADTLTLSFRKSNIQLADSRIFNPHLTILKLSRAPKLRRMGIKKIDPLWYVYYKNEVFGVQETDRMQLLRMGQPKEEDGYYYCVKDCPFDSINENKREISNLQRKDSPNKLLATTDVKNNVRKHFHSLTIAALKKVPEASHNTAGSGDENLQGEKTIIHEVGEGKP